MDGGSPLRSRSHVRRLAVAARRPGRPALPDELCHNRIMNSYLKWNADVDVDYSALVFSNLIHFKKHQI